MNIKKAIFFVLIIVSLLLPFVAMAQAQKVPKYVGIKEGTTYTWKTEFDDGPLADYYEDLGLPADVAEAAAENDFDNYELSTKTEAWKIYIVDLYPEVEEDVWGTGVKYDRVKYVYNWYKTKDATDPDAWKKVEKYDTSKIYEPDEDLYRHFVDIEWGIDAFFLPKRLHFEDIVDHIDETYENDKDDDNHDAAISTVKTQFFLQKKIVGITTEWNWKLTSDMESFESISKYTDDGILYYYEWTYDGDIIEKLELDTIGGTYLIENFWWIALVAGAVIVAVIVVVIVIIVKKKR